MNPQKKQPINPETYISSVGVGKRSTEIVMPNLKERFIKYTFIEVRQARILTPKHLVTSCRSSKIKLYDNDKRRWRPRKWKSSANRIKLNARSQSIPVKCRSGRATLFVSLRCGSFLPKDSIRHDPDRADTETMSRSQLSRREKSVPVGIFEVWRGKKIRTEAEERHDGPTRRPWCEIRKILPYAIELRQRCSKAGASAVECVPTFHLRSTCKNDALVVFRRQRSVKTAAEECEEE